MTSPQGGQPPKAKKQKRQKPILESLPNGEHPGHSKFARALASTDYRTREKGLHALRSWLLRKSDLQDSDMARIWKGLFYCFWHSDKALVQAELADRLAAIVTQLPEQAAYLYFTAFMSTMRREWFGIDRLRMDKFLMLIRKFIHHLLARLKASKWQTDFVERYADYLHHHVMLPGDTLSAAGVAYHCGDVLLDELRGVAEGRAVPASALALLLQPFIEALQKGEQAFLQRIGEGLFDTLLSELACPTDDSHYLQKLDVAALATQLFDRGAAPNTRVRNRKVLYDLSSALEKLQRKRQRVDEGSQAGPSSQEELTAKVSKKHLKEKRVAANIAPVEPLVANGDVGHVEADACAVPTARLKRKAKVMESLAASNATQHETAPAGGENAELLGPRKQKFTKKKKRAQEHVQGDGEGLQLEVPTTLQPASTEAGGKSGVKKRQVLGPAHKEPTTGQKVAFRAAVADLMSTIESGGVGATPQKPEKNMPEAALKQVAKNEAMEHKASATTPLLGGESSPLGKRVAPGSGLKVASALARKAQLQDGGLTPAKTPVQSSGGRVRARPLAKTTAKKGRVVINLKKNLYFEHGGPVPDPDVRTPPPARAKGGILKKSAQSCPPKVASIGSSVLFHKHNHTSEKQQSSRVLPKQARRPSAALFF